MQPKHIGCLTLWFYPESNAPDFLLGFNQRDNSVIDFMSFRGWFFDYSLPLEGKVARSAG